MGSAASKRDEPHKTGEGIRSEGATSPRKERIPSKE